MATKLPQYNLRKLPTVIIDFILSVLQNERKVQLKLNPVTFLGVLLEKEILTLPQLASTFCSEPTNCVARFEVYLQFPGIISNLNSMKY